MNRITLAAGLGLALALGAGSAMAQQAQPRQDHPEHGQHRGEHKGQGRAQGRGFGHGYLLKGITLTAEQRRRLDSLHVREKATSEAERTQRKAHMEQVRAARQRGDTAAVRAHMLQGRAQMEQRQAEHVTALRTVLTVEQQRQLDANLAEMRERQARATTRGEARGQGREVRGRQGGSGRRG